jgi:exopolysaccharide biosynthesis protein
MTLNYLLIIINSKTDMMKGVVADEILRVPIADSARNSIIIDGGIRNANDATIQHAPAINRAYD